MKTNKIYKNSTFEKELKKSNLEILTDENDNLVKNLKKPGGSLRA